MAQSNQDRHIKHIKDVFSNNTGSSPQQDTTKHGDNGPGHTAKPKSTQPPNSDEVFFKKVERVSGPVNGSGGTGGQVIGGSVRVRLPSSRKKRPAPKPPDDTKHTKTTSDESKVRIDTGDNSSRGHEILYDTKSMSLGSGRQHLGPLKNEERGEKARQTFLHSKSAALTRVVTGPNKATTPTTPTTTGNSTGINLAKGKRVDMNGGSHTPPPPTPPPPPPPPPLEVYPDQDSQTCATSVLSDSGTASSGYQSEDMIDAPKIHTMNVSGIPISEEFPPPPPALIEVAPDVDKEDGCFEEEGFTLEFDEEEEGFVEGRQTILYKEYQGEDFSRYLQEEPYQDVDESPAATPYRNKYRKHKDTSPSSSNSSTLDTKKKGFKEKFGQMFTLSKQHKTKEQKNPRSGNIQSFSFADSKIGVVLSNGGSPVPVRKTVKNPDQGFKDAGLHKTWWNTDTLSARSLQNNSDIIVRKKRSSSVPDILDCPDYSDPNSHAINQRDFESYRKSQIYDSKGQSSAKKAGWWSKLTRKKKKVPTATLC